MSAFKCVRNDWHTFNVNNLIFSSFLNGLSNKCLWKTDNKFWTARRVVSKRRTLMSQLMRLWYLSHRRPAKAQESLRICTISHTWSMEVDKGSNQKSDIKPHWMAAHGRLKNEVMEDAFKAWGYGGWKVLISFFVQYPHAVSMCNLLLDPKSLI